MTDKSERFDRAALVAELMDAGAKFRGNECRCPFCDDKHPSAGVYETKSGVWKFKCHKCGFNGDVFDVRAKVRGVPLADVLPKSADKTPVRATEQRTPGRRYPTAEACAQAYTERHSGCLLNVYPYPDDSAVFRYATPDGPKNFAQCRKVGELWENGAPPKPWALQGIESLDEFETDVLYVEGEKDRETGHALKIATVTHRGGAGNAKHSDLSPLKGRAVRIFPDKDPKGFANAENVAELALKAGAASVSIIDVKSLGLPEKGDLSDYIERYAAETIETKRAAVLELMRMAKPTVPSASLTELIERTIDGTRQAIPLPWPRLSRLARPLLPATITVKCGAPGSGKTFWCLDAAHHMHAAGVPVAMYCLEETRADALLRLLAQLVGDPRLLDPEHVRDNPETTRAALAAHQSDLDTFASCIHDAPEAQPTLDDLAEWVHERATEGNRVIVIDPISVADMGSEPWNAATKFMVSAGRAIRGTGASLVLSVHPSKTATLNRLVDMGAVAGGASFTRLCQTVLWLEHHPDDHIVQVVGMTGASNLAANRTIHILKSRNGPGQGARLAFQFRDLRFHEIGIVTTKEKRAHE